MATDPQVPVPGPDRIPQDHRDAAPGVSERDAAPGVGERDAAPGVGERRGATRGASPQPPTGPEQSIGASFAAPDGGEHRVPGTLSEPAAAPPAGPLAQPPAPEPGHGVGAPSPQAASDADAQDDEPSAAQRLQQVRERVQHEVSDRINSPGSDGQSPAQKVGHLRERIQSGLSERLSASGTDGESPAQKLGKLRSRFQGEAKRRSDDQD